MVATANIPLHHVRGEQSEHPMVGSDIIYEGAMLGLSAGYARPLTAGDPFLGHAAEYYDNSSGSSGDHNILLYRGRYRLQVTITGVAITDVGKRVFASADDTLTLTAGANSQVGVVVRYVATDTAIVEFQTHEVSTMVSDLTALLSNLATVTGTSDFTSLQSDVVTLKSDNTINKSHLVSSQSDLVVLKSDMTAEKSDTVIFKANRTKELKAISDAIAAKVAGDSANASDLYVTLGEVLKAFSDALI